jgi:putative Holliday junction resolvase
LRLLALDVGDRRIGVALSDPIGILASPLTTIQRRSEREDVQAVLDLVEEHDVGEIVVGMPLSLSGERGPQARQVGRFRAALAARAGVKTTDQDERYSTVQAERLMRQAGAEPSRERERVDAAAAAVVLQAYLDAGRMPDSGSEGGGV